MGRIIFHTLPLQKAMCIVFFFFTWAYPNDIFLFLVPYKEQPVSVDLTDEEMVETDHFGS